MYIKSASSWSVKKNYISDLFLNLGSSVTRYITYFDADVCASLLVPLVLSLVILLLWFRCDYFYLSLFRSIYVVILIRVVSIVKCDRCQSKT